MYKVFIGPLILFGVIHQAASQKSSGVPQNTLPPINIKTIPPQYYRQSLGFFCEKELQLQKKTGVNLFLRLGTKEYVDYLEQKPNAVRKL